MKPANWPMGAVADISNPCSKLHLLPSQQPPASHSSLRVCNPSHGQVLVCHRSHAAAGAVRSCRILSLQRPKRRALSFCAFRMSVIVLDGRGSPLIHEASSVLWQPVCVMQCRRLSLTI